MAKGKLTPAEASQLLSGLARRPGDPVPRHRPLEGTPILDFEEDFVVAFVDALDQIMPIKNRFAGVIGGSLGGNLGLRLGRRDMSTNPWLGASIVSWSAASVWDPMIRDEIKRKGPDRCRDYWDLPETIPSRADYFAEVFDRFIHPVFMRTNQPAFWYSNNWIPCKQLHINAARIARRETYCSKWVSTSRK